MSGKATAKDAFNMPVPVPGGRELTTLGDAFAYIDQLPPDVQSRPEWLLAIKELHTAVTKQRSWMIFARMALFRAIHGSTELPISKPPRVKKQDAWRKRRKKR